MTNKKLPALSSRRAVLLLFSLFATTAAMAQAGLGENGMNAAMVKLFAGNTAFTAHAEFRVVDQHQKETMFMPAAYEFLNGKTRMEVDMSQVKSAEEPAFALTALKQMGMDDSVMISRPDLKLSYNIYPHAKAYAQITMTKDEKAALETNFKMDKTPLGSETIDGHPCQKSRVTFSAGDKGTKLDATVWSANDLKDFPLQLQFSPDADSTITIKYKDVKLESPDAKEFDAPVGLTKYDSAEALREALNKAPESGTGK